MKWSEEALKYKPVTDQDVVHFAPPAKKAMAIDRYNRAVRQIEKGNVDMAAISLKSLTAEYPAFVQAAQLNACCQMIWRDTEAASRALTELLKRSMLTHVEREKTTRYLSLIQRTEQNIRQRKQKLPTDHRPHFNMNRATPALLETTGSLHPMAVATKAEVDALLAGRTYSDPDAEPRPPRRVTYGSSLRHSESLSSEKLRAARAAAEQRARARAEVERRRLAREEAKARQRKRLEEQRKRLEVQRREEEKERLAAEAQARAAAERSAAEAKAKVAAEQAAAEAKARVAAEQAAAEAKARVAAEQAVAEAEARAAAEQAVAEAEARAAAERTAAEVCAETGAGGFSDSAKQPALEAPAVIRSVRLSEASLKAHAAEKAAAEPSAAARADSERCVDSAGRVDLSNDPATAGPADGNSGLSHPDPAEIAAIRPFRMSAKPLPAGVRAPKLGLASAAEPAADTAADRFESGSRIDFEEPAAESDANGQISSAGRSFGSSAGRSAAVNAEPAADAAAFGFAVPAPESGYGPVSPPTARPARVRPTEAERLRRFRRHCLVAAIVVLTTVVLVSAAWLIRRRIGVPGRRAEAVPAGTALQSSSEAAQPSDTGLPELSSVEGIQTTAAASP